MYCTNSLHTQMLIRELQRRRQSNPRYSLRAFARNLGIDASGLSRILTGKQEVSLSLSLKIMQRLTLSAEQCHLFADSVAEERRDRALSVLRKAIPENNHQQRTA